MGSTLQEACGSGRMVIAADCKSVGLSFEVQFLSAENKIKGIVKWYNKDFQNL